MKTDFFTLAAELITSVQFIYAYISVIGIIFLGVILQFFISIRPLKNSLKTAVGTISSVASMDSFAAEFPEIDDRICRDKVLMHPWTEFKETLLFPGEALYDKVELIHNTHPASFFFSRESIIAPNLNLRLYNAFPGILTAMGILGTFLGLVAGIYLASDGLAASELSKAKEALDKLLSGASLAFLTSIAGLLTSMIASALEKRALYRVDGLVEKFVISLDKLVKRLPAEKIQASIHRENQQQTKALQSFTNDLAVKFAEVLEEKISQPMGASLDLLLESLESLRTDQAKASDELLTRLITEFSASISGAAGNEMSRFAETLEQLNKVFTEQISSAQSSQAKANELLNDSVKALIQCVGEIATATEKNQDLILQSTSLLSLAKESQGEMLATIEPLKTLAESVSESNRTSIDVAGILKDCSVNLSSSVENLAEIEDQIQQTWSSYEKRFENVDNQLANTFRVLQEGLEAYAATTSTYLFELEEKTGKIITHLAGGTKGLEDAIQDLAEVIDQGREE